MNGPRTVTTRLALLWAGLSALAAGSAALATDPGFDAQGRSKLPKFGDIAAVIEGHFEELDMDPRDLVTRSDVQPLFPKLKAAGWQVPDADKIVELVPDDGEPWVLELTSTKAGQKFAREVGRLPAGFDKVDRMCRMPHGLTQLAGLINNPAGWKFFAYLSVSPGGHNLGEMVSRAPKGRNFNSRTGRIYTQEELLARLRETYDEQVAAGLSVRRGR
ncbi:MAG: hypothetical protein K2Y37_27425 [Pirellulales bacterium]|nr:hypothetical protein [Pirellulales bacterium]